MTPGSHVQFERVLYSAPFTLVGKTLWLRATDAAVALFEDYRHVATHAPGKGGDHHNHHTTAQDDAASRRERERDVALGRGCTSSRHWCGDGCSLPRRALPSTQGCTRTHTTHAPPREGLETKSRQAPQPPRSEI